MKYLLRTLFLSLISLTAFATVHQVNSGMFFYAPNELTINIGDTVVWINDGGTHDVNGNISSISGESLEILKVLILLQLVLLELLFIRTFLILLAHIIMTALLGTMLYRE